MNTSIARFSPFSAPAQRAQVRCAGWLVVLSVLVLTGCGTMGSGPVAETQTAPVARPNPQPKARPAPDVAAPTPATPGGGGYYKDDGPGSNPPEDVGVIADAQPKAEPLHRYANRPYTVMGKSYKPLREVGTYKARGRASWYGKRFHGNKTSTGEIYDMYAMTAAHPTLPLPSYARVTNLSNGKSVLVRVNDRGPFHANRIIDLSWTAASKLGYIANGSAMVEVESLLPGEEKNPLPEQLAASPNENTALAPGATAGAGSGPWLQLGAFGQRDNAEAMKSRLYAQLGDLGGKLTVRESNNLYRVQLGPWADAIEARSVADRLASQHEVRAVLVQP